MHPNPKKIAPIVVIAVLAAAAWWYTGSERAAADTGRLSASGTIEATQVTIAPEIGGQVAAVLVEEGETVQAGQVVVRFDDSLLQAQLEQAQASLVLAQANYDLVAAGTPEEQRQAAIAAAELELTNARQAMEDLYENAPLAAAQAMQAVAAAENAVDKAAERVDNLNADAPQSDLDAAYAAMILAKDRLEKAQKDYNPYEKKPEDNTVRALLLSKLAEAQKQYDATVTRYNNLGGSVNELDLNLSTAELAVAEAQLEDARRRYAQLKDGPDREALELARARLAAAEARLAAAQADPSPEQLAVAQQQIDVAQAAAAVLQAQLDRLVLVAPSAGVVLTRSVEPGETAAPGTPLLTLARLDDLTITIFIPEDRYGRLQIGQTAGVSVDSFPGETFAARVVQIADQAEFTPRNVQTAEGRRTTVFAVRLAVQNPDGRLKPGMPADVVFGE